LSRSNKKTQLFGTFIAEDAVFSTARRL